MLNRSQIPLCKTCKSYPKDPTTCYYGDPQETCPIFISFQLLSQKAGIKTPPKPRKPRQKASKAEKTLRTQEA
jgi:hypothetical protein